MFEKIKKFFSEKFSLLKRSKDYSINPGRDWKIILFLFFLTNLILFIYFIVSFVNFSNESVFNHTSISAQSHALDEKKLKEVIKIYSLKEEQLDFLLKEAPVTVDPSL